MVEVQSYHCAGGYYGAWSPYIYLLSPLHLYSIREASLLLDLLLHCYQLSSGAQLNQPVTYKCL